jgi:predicted benzoate:H+ symporter BenE
MATTKGFKFSMRELGKSLGHISALLPFTIGYIVICGFNPTGLLVGIGLTNIIVALVYRLPLKLQPQKAVGSIVLAERWTKNTVLGATFSVGLMWVVLSFSKRLTEFLAKIPKPVIRGIQLGLAFTLAIAGAEMTHPDYLIAIPLLALTFLLIKNRYLPAAVFLIGFGFVFATVMGPLDLNQITLGFSVPELTLFSLNDVLNGLIYAGLAQLFLTVSNTAIATVALVHDQLPNQHNITQQKLVRNMAAINVTTPFIGGMPICHETDEQQNAQHLFGAHTAGATVMEGILEICLGLFFAQSLVSIFTAFPMFVIGVILIIIAFELGKISLRLENKNEAYTIITTAILATAFNMAIGLIGGLLLYFALEKKVIKI